MFVENHGLLSIIYILPSSIM